MNTPQADILLVKEVAAVLRLGLSTVYQLIQSGKLPAYKFGGIYRVRRHDLDDFLDGNRVDARGKRKSVVRPCRDTRTRSFQALDADKLKRAWLERGVLANEFAPDAMSLGPPE